MRANFALIISFTFAGALLGVSGCCTKNKCGTPPSTIKIRDVAGNRVGAATVVGSDVEVLKCDITADCDYSFQAVTGVITLNSPGYKSTTVNIEPREDDCGNAVEQRIDVTLRLETAAEPSTASTTAGESCEH